VNPYFLTKTEHQRFNNLDIEIRFTGEMDEFWSFVQNKGNQRWTWYSIERQSGCVLAWHNGRRTDKDFLVLWNYLQVFDIAKYYTDDLGSYSKYIPRDRHQTGKDKTWKIERKKLNFRTHLKRLTRKTICFSKNEQVHDNVIGLYIGTFYYRTGKYENNFIN
jgi:insertion element IS1 protein InsB